MDFPKNSRQQGRLLASSFLLADPSELKSAGLQSLLRTTTFLRLGERRRPCATKSSNEPEQESESL